MKESFGSSLMPYGIASVAAVSSLLLGWGLGSSIGQEASFLFPVAAVIFSAWYGGFGPGLLTAALIASAGDHPLPESHFVPAGIRWGAAYRIDWLAVLSLGGAIIGGLAAAARTARRRHAVRAEETCVASDQYRLLFEGNPHPMWVFDRETLEFRAVNDTTVAHYGYSREEFLGMTIADICLAEDVAPLVGDLSRSWGPARFYTGSWRHKRKNGTLIDVEITANALSFGGRFCWVVLVHDVTTRKRAQEATRFLAGVGEVLASSLDYETTLGSVARLAVPHVADFCVIDMVVEPDSIRRVAVAHVNPAKEELVRALWRRDPLASDSLQPTLKAIRTRRSHLDSELDEGTVLASSDPEHGRIIRALGFRSLIVVPLVARDRTLGAIALGVSESPRRFDRADLALAEELARRAALAVDNARLYHEAEEARRGSETANQAKDRFLAMLSHELRTPLAPVLMVATAMLEGPATDPEIRPALEMIRRNIELEARLIDDLFDVSRISGGKMALHPEVVNAHALIPQALEICRGEIRSGGLQIELDMAATASHVRADPARLQQVLWNLIKNAVKFTPANGKLSIRSRNVGWPPGGTAEERLIVEVSDTGIGIERDLIPRIFDAFEQGEVSITRRFGGLGLGLAISRAVVEAHGGSLTAASEGKGRGATFTIALATVPVRADEVPIRPRPPRLAPPHRVLKILLVDDNTDTLRYLALVLSQHGLVVLTADSLSSALQVAAGENIDLVISDIELPDGTGLELMRTLRAGRAMPGIALSGFGSNEDITLSRSAGFDEHLTKPIDFRTLVAAIERITPDLEQFPINSVC